MFDLGMTGEIGAVFFQQSCQVVNGILGEMSKFLAQSFHLFEDGCQLFLVLLNVKTGNSADGKCKEFFHILIAHITAKLFTERRNARVHFSNGKLVGLALFDALVNAVFKEDLSQCLGVEEFRLPFKGDFQFPFEVEKQLVGVAAQNVAHGHHTGTALTDHRQID